MATIKLKARDIVPGWPRGRSTMPLWDTSNYLWMPIFRCWFWSKQAIMLWEMDLLNDEKYHQRQAETMENFRRVNNAFGR